MDRFVEFGDDDDEDSDEGDNRRHKIYRDMRFPLDELNDTEIYDRYRFDKAGIRRIVEIVREDVEFATNRTRAISVEMQVLATLNYLAGNGLQINVGDTFGLHQTSMSRSIARDTAALARRIGEFVGFPIDGEEINRIKRQYFFASTLRLSIFFLHCLTSFGFEGNAIVMISHSSAHAALLVFANSFFLEGGYNASFFILHQLEKFESHCRRNR